MRRHMCQVISVAAVIVLLSTSAAVAQSDMQLVGDIPFSFHVGQSTLPAGAYVVKSCSTASGNRYITIRRMSNGHEMMLLTLPAAVGNESGKPRLVFAGYGSDFFLSKILSPSHGIGLKLFSGKLEKEYAAGKASTTEVAMDAR